MIRRMEKSEARAVMDVWLRTSNYSNSFVESDFWTMHYEFVKQKYIDRKDTFVYIKDNTIVAFTVVDENNEICGLFVEPVYQNRGIGGELIEFLQSEYNRLRTEIYAKNRKAFAFSMQMGFTVEGASRQESNNEIMYTMVWGEDDKEDDVKIWRR